MIPAFNEKGFLPPGIHDATWEQFVERYAITEHRTSLIKQMKTLIVHLKEVGSRSLFVDGSFVTNKERPNDYDACWDVHGVKIEVVDPILLDLSPNGKQQIEDKYGGDIRPDLFSPIETEGTYLEFFQEDRDGDPKGIVRLSLREIEL